jgi:hypothetical protein
LNVKTKTRYTVNEVIDKSVREVDRLEQPLREMLACCRRIKATCERLRGRSLSTADEQQLRTISRDLKLFRRAKCGG